MHSERLHALDAVRAWALLLGIALHGTMSFVIGIPAIDNSPSTTLTVLFYVIHIFRMSLFYIVAGFFACMMLEKKGWREFARNRLRRIGLPLVIFWFILLPLTLGPALWGIYRSYTEEQIAELTSADEGGFPLFQLWFLYYLLIFYAIALGGYLLLQRGGYLQHPAYLRLRVWGQNLIGSPVAALLLAVPVAHQFLRLDNWYAWAGIPTHDAGILPQLNQIVIYGTAFFCGWLLFGRQDILARWRRHWPWYLGAAVILSGGCLALVGTQTTLDLTYDYFAGRPRLEIVYACAYAVAIWCWSFGLIGMALQYFSRHSATTRYLADASYWLYLMHIPVIFFLQVLMMDWPLHWTVKYPLILALTCAFLLWLYQRYIRPGWFGELLNGKRHPRRLPNAQAPATD